MRLIRRVNMKKNIKGFFSLYLMIIIGISLVSPANALIYHQFYGNATDQTGQVIEDGTIITAHIINKSDPNDVIYRETAVDNSLIDKNYDFGSMEVPDSYEGGIIHFFIGSENSNNDSMFKNNDINDPNGSSYFNITIDDIPQIVDISDDSGFTGDLFAFNVVVVDYVDSPSNLIVNVSWTHDIESGYSLLSNVGGDSFQGDITLGGSIEPLTYTIEVSDSSGNENASGPHSVNIVDNDDPEIISDSGDISCDLGGSVDLWVTGSDNIDVSSAEISVDSIVYSMTWDGGDSRWEYVFTAPSDDTSGHSYEISIFDVEGYSDSSGPYTITIADNIAPEISNLPSISPITGEDYNFTVEVDDNIAVSQVFLNYDFEDGWNNVSMIYSSNDDLYYIVISTPAGASIFNFYVSAKDTSNNWAETGINDLAVIDNINPSIDTDNSPSEGTTGDSYIFNIIASDNIAVDSVNISWSHDSLSNNLVLSYNAGVWSGTIILDNSIENMYYSIQATDTSLNYIRSEIKTVTVTDNDLPSSTLDDIIEYWNNFDDNPLQLTCIASDNNGVKEVNLFYQYSDDNTSFTDPIFYDVDTNIDDGISWSFDFPDGDGFYRFYSIAVDNTDQAEPIPTLYDTNCAYDIVKPSSEITDIDPFWQITSPYTITANTNEDLENIKQVTLYYAYSTDNQTWTGPNNYGTDNNPSNGISWSFNYPQGENNFYKFYSIATDKADNVESTPTSYDTKCFYGNNQPATPEIPQGSTSKKTGQESSYSTSTTDPDNDKIRYGWDWDGDGTVDEWTILYDSGETISLLHSWAKAGTFNIKVKAKDEIGRMSSWSDSLKVTVKRPDNEGGGGGSGGGGGGGADYIIVVKMPPKADAGGPYIGYVNETVDFDATDSSDSDGKITEYDWDFGDNSDGNGINPTHKYKKIGIYNISLIVTDNDGLKNRNRTKVNIIKNPKDVVVIDDENESSYDFDNDSFISQIELNGKTYYIVDLENNGIPNLFYDSEKGIITVLIPKEGNIYLVDITGTGKYEYEFEYTFATNPETEKEEIETKKVLIQDQIFTEKIYILIFGIACISFATLIAIGLLIKIGYISIDDKKSIINKTIIMPESKPKKTKKPTKKSTNKSSKKPTNKSTKNISTNKSVKKSTKKTVKNPYKQPKKISKKQTKNKISQNSSKTSKKKKIKVRKK